MKRTTLSLAICALALMQAQPAAADVYVKVDAQGNAIGGAIVCDASVCGPGTSFSERTLQPGEQYVLQGTGSTGIGNNNPGTSVKVDLNTNVWTVTHTDAPELPVVTSTPSAQPGSQPKPSPTDAPTPTPTPTPVPQPETSTPVVVDPPSVPMTPSTPTIPTEQPVTPTPVETNTAVVSSESMTALLSVVDTFTLSLYESVSLASGEAYNFSNIATLEVFNTDSIEYQIFILDFYQWIFQRWTDWTLLWL